MENLGAKNVEEGKQLREDHKRTSKIPVRKCRAKLADTLDKISYHTNPDNTNWGKYAYLGLYSGLYGILCLLLIGIEGSWIQKECRNFLLISSEIIIAFELISIIQIKKVTDGEVSYLKVYKNIKILLTLLALATLSAYTGWYFHFFNAFNPPFVLLATVAVYMPVIVYVVRLWITIRKVRKLYDDCNRQLIEFKQLIHSPAPDR
ncbi:MAG: hypothetical protein K2N88_08990 [Muribaculaceae bacterium]|nr:hypothetical protein [Muribaculaceae bacterium]